MAASITDLKQYGKHGWQWKVNGREYRTNGSGEGLWLIGSYSGQWADNYQDRQVTGTCQFSLPKYSDNPQIKRRVRSALYRAFPDD